MPSMDAAALQDFVLVATHGGFRAAGRAAGRPTATLSRHVSALEVELGLRLVERNEKAFRLTEAGERLLAAAKAPLAELDALADAMVASHGELRGRLKISAAVVFAHAHLARLAATFAAKHPGVEIEIVADDRMVDPVEEGFDIVIRANPAADERLVGRCIVRTDRVAVAAPWMTMPAEGEPARLILRGNEPLPRSWRLRSNDGAHTVLLRPAMRLSTLLMMREAALHGAGVALFPRTLVNDDLVSGRLAEWGVLEAEQTEIWALHISRRLPSPKVGAFLRHLESASLTDKSAATLPCTRLTDE